MERRNVVVDALRALLFRLYLLFFFLFFFFSVAMYKTALPGSIELQGPTHGRPSLFFSGPSCSPYSFHPLLLLLLLLEDVDVAREECRAS